MKKRMNKYDDLIFVFLIIVLVSAVLIGIKALTVWLLIGGFCLWIKYSKSRFAQRVRNSL